MHVRWSGGFVLLAALLAGTTAAAQSAGSLSAMDYIEIQQLYVKYNEAIDAGDAQAYAATFTEDGIFNTFKGREALLGFANQWREKMNGTTRRHWNTNLRITPTAEGASGGVYLLLVDITAKPPAIQTAARYEDRLVKTPQGWRFKQRTTRPEAPAVPPKPSSQQ